MSSSSYAPPYYADYPTDALPIPPTKGQYGYGASSGYPPYGYPSTAGGCYYPSGGESAYSSSPPDGEEEEDAALRAASVSSGSAYGRGYSHTTTSYAGRSSDYYDSTAASVTGSTGSSSSSSGAGSAAGVDLHEYMQDRFAATFDPIALDRCTATQAQTSGHLNAKHRELLELQAKAQARLAQTRARFARGLEDAREVRNDLEWTQKKLESLKAKASKKHPKEYARARARYPSPDAY
ncbi:hypothetical protein VTJ49DRAFT_5274 [Mycothermus thermophilus]|uniref:Biogenesis of lysosome-related organelles complex 1 subunit KXD1 n=1 Tax=Humicola insolens TaxID=85995 RepID=A0ABR3VLS0_HUMIN